MKGVVVGWGWGVLIHVYEVRLCVLGEGRSERLKKMWKVKERRVEKGGSGICRCCFLAH